MSHDHADGEARWHMSVSHPFRYPTWDEICRAKDAALPGIFVSFPLPPVEYWLNIGHVFHLWEFRDEWMREQCILDGEGARARGVSMPTDVHGHPRAAGTLITPTDSEKVS